MKNIPEKHEGVPVLFIEEHEIYEGPLGDYQQIPVTIGYPSSKTNSGTRYKTYAVGVRVRTPKREWTIKRKLSLWANCQLADAAKNGEVVVRVMPEIETFIDQQTLDPWVRLYMRYAVE